MVVESFLVKLVFVIALKKQKKGKPPKLKTYNVGFYSN